MTEDLALEALTDFFNAVEAGIVAARERIKEKKGLTGQKESYDLEKILWQPAQGSAGPYEKSEDANNPHFQALVNDLAKHNGRMTKGQWFIWLFSGKEGIVGRKKRRK